MGAGVVGTLSGAVGALQSVRRWRERGTARDDPSPVAVHNAIWMEMLRTRLPTRNSEADAGLERRGLQMEMLRMRLPTRRPRQRSRRRA